MPEPAESRRVYTAPVMRPHGASQEIAFLQAAEQPTEVIDPTGQRQERNRRKLRRVLLPTIGITLVLGSMFAIGYHSYILVRTNTIKLSNELLNATQNYIAQEVTTYLSPAQLGSRLVQDLLQHGALDNNGKLFNFYAGGMLRQVPQIQAFYLANSDGDFALVQRDSNGGTEIVLVSAGPDRIRLRSVMRNNANGELISSEPPSPDPYDPRTSNYYQQPVRTRQPYWSPPYIFKPTGRPVITTSTAYHNADTRDHVIAVNISLDQLSSFLDSLKIGEHGYAVIAQKNGQIVASRDVLGQAALDPVKAHIAAEPKTGQDTPLSRAFNIFHVSGYGPGSFTLKRGQDSEDYVFIAARLPAGAPDWVLLIVLPTKDFAAFGTQDSRSMLLYSGMTVALAMVLAGLLIRQGRRVEHVMDVLTDQNQRAEDERRSLQQLMSHPDIFDGSEEAPILTEHLASVSQAQRASIWHIGRNGRTLHCEDIYDRRRDSHMGGFSLGMTEAGPLLEAIEGGEAFTIQDAAADPRTERLYRLHMRNSQTRSLSVQPIPDQDGFVGAIMLEDAGRLAESRHIVSILSGIVGIRLRSQTEAAMMPDLSMPQTIATQSAPLQPMATESSLLSPHDQPGWDSLQNGVFPSIVAMVITFDVQPLAMSNQADQAAIIRLVGDMASDFQEIARTHDIFSLKLAGHRLFAVSGCSSTPDPQAALQMGDAALAIRDACITRLAGEEIDPNFHIGIDVGPAMGTWLGKDPAVFNIWGQALQGAEAMTQGNALPGSIQVTEAAYKLLRSHFLFRNRGAFYTPQTGISRAYSMAGRQ
ncbi:Two-component sensor and regulator [Granulibacter bethesdensis]|uniref:Two-component sensor and regulator n=1 Tax=Granulibacter bethesdensis TaxID=364410 RepID=A0AAN0REC5_9PROT|nr:cache domain-containing protein [Granulibacter bethesdensis]AHJ63307.1 Two-component sensor and regulator [Granulibacter bethesdensis]